jgi:hypothetical protein
MNKTRDSLEITVLMNSVYYFLHWVIIIREDGYYRLVVLNNEEMIFDKKFRSIRGAKIAFSKLFPFQIAALEPKSEWTPFYKPDPKYLEDKLNHPYKPV